MMIKFGENSMYLDGKDNFKQDLPQLDGWKNITVEIEGEGSHLYEFSVYENGNKKGIKIDHQGITFLISGETN